MYLQTINMLQCISIENYMMWLKIVHLFSKLLVGGKWHNFGILVFQIGFLVGKIMLQKDFM